MNITPKLVGAAAAIVLLAGGAVATATYVAAQDSNQPKDTNKLQAFIGKVAANLNVTPDQLKTAVKDAEIQTVDEKVAAGDLTQEQASKIKDRINNSQGLGLGRFFGEGRHKDGTRGQIARRGILESAATAIGIDAKALMSELRSGNKSIADVAAEHNVSLDAVKTRITNDAKAKLDEAVKNGRIDQAREDAMLKDLSDHLDALLSKKHGAPDAGNSRMS